MTTARAPAPDEKAQTLVSIIETYYRDHPGLHRCQDVAAALSHPRIDTRRVAVESKRMTTRKTNPLQHRKVPMEGRSDLSMYGYLQ